MMLERNCYYCNTVLKEPEPNEQLVFETLAVDDELFKRDPQKKGICHACGEKFSTWKKFLLNNPDLIEILQILLDDYRSSQ